MKKILFYLCLSTITATFAQEITVKDALRYGLNNLNGTARFKAMGGAFGAVGADLSAMNINPAGTALFNNNQATISLSNFNKSNNANYFGTSSKTKDNSLDINQIGAVFVFKDNSGKSGWKKLTLGLNYENTNNFDDYVVSEGVNTNNSMDAYFLQYANSRNGSVQGFNYANIDFTDQQALLGFKSYLLNYISAGDFYESNVPTGGNYYQKNTIKSEGYNGKFTVNFSGAYEDKLFVGMNFNFNFTDYIKATSLYESNENPLYNSGRTVEAARFNNELYTYGNGFSMNLGAIYKATDNVRFGLAYETPTWYQLNDELTQSIATKTTDGTLNYNDTYNPNVTNIYPAYKLQTPSKLTGSTAIILGKKAVISVDYAMKNYDKTKFKPNDEYLAPVNNRIKQQLTNNTELRIGGEYKIKRFSFRGGYRFEESPYKINYAMGDLFSYSGGLGYNFGNSKLDISFTNEHRERTEALLTSGLNDAARIKNYNNNITLTYVVNF